MNGTERTGADAWERGANADLDATCVTADGGAEEKRPTMRMIKEMITAPERESGSPSDARKDQPVGALPSDWQGHLGSHLRALYGALVNEPVPDKFFHLLKELEAKEQEGKS